MGGKEVERHFLFRHFLFSHELGIRAWIGADIPKSTQTQPSRRAGPFSIKILADCSESVWRQQVGVKFFDCKSRGKGDAAYGCPVRSCVGARTWGFSSGQLRCRDRDNTGKARFSIVWGRTRGSSRPVKFLSRHSPIGQDPNPEQKIVLTLLAHFLNRGNSVTSNDRR